MRVAIKLTSHGGDLPRSLGDLRATVEQLPAELARAAGDVGGPAILDAARAARGTLSMSNNRQLSGELGITVIPRDTNVEFVATPMGPWYLAEFGGRPPGKSGQPGRIVPKRKYGARRRAGALSTPQGPRARVNNHPGASPRPGWQAGVRAALPKIRTTIEETVTERLGRG